MTDDGIEKRQPTSRHFLQTKGGSRQMVKFLMSKHKLSRDGEFSLMLNYPKQGCFCHITF
jgi:hypothetical protein